MGKAIITTIIVLILIAVGIFFLIKTPAEKDVEEDVHEPEVVSSQEEGLNQDQEPVQNEIVEQEQEVQNQQEEVNNSIIGEVAVSATDSRFNPSSITAKAGQNMKIVFTNNGSMHHDFVIEGLGVRTNAIGPGQTETVEFLVPAPGNYTFYCSVDNHRELGMVGSFIVE